MSAVHRLVRLRGLVDARPVLVVAGSAGKAPAGSSSSTVPTSAAGPAQGASGAGLVGSALTVVTSIGPAQSAGSATASTPSAAGLPGVTGPVGAAGQAPTATAPAIGVVLTLLPGRSAGAAGSVVSGDGATAHHPGSAVGAGGAGPVLAGDDHTLGSMWPAASSSSTRAPSTTAAQPPAAVVGAVGAGTAGPAVTGDLSGAAVTAAGGAGVATSVGGGIVITGTIGPAAGVGVATPIRSRATGTPRVIALSVRVEPAQWSFAVHAAAPRFVAQPFPFSFTVEVPVSDISNYSDTSVSITVTAARVLDGPAPRVYFIHPDGSTSEWAQSEWWTPPGRVRECRVQVGPSSVPLQVGDNDVVLSLSTDQDDLVEAAGTVPVYGLRAAPPAA